MKKLLVTVFFLNMLASAQTNNGIAFYGFKMVENDKRTLLDILAWYES